MCAPQDVGWRRSLRGRHLRRRRWRSRGGGLRESRRGKKKDKKYKSEKAVARDLSAHSRVPDWPVVRIHFRNWNISASALVGRPFQVFPDSILALHGLGV
jgi:transposase InsO family protein